MKLNAFWAYDLLSLEKSPLQPLIPHLNTYVLGRILANYSNKQSIDFKICNVIIFIITYTYPIIIEEIFIVV